jgi:hypothetical protein
VIQAGIVGIDIFIAQHQYKGATQRGPGAGFINA